MTSKTQIDAAIQKLETALNECPVRKGGADYFEKPCPKCGATDREPCWINVAANDAFVADIKAITGEDIDD